MKRTIATTVSDLSGEEPADTLHFSFEKARYEVDLTKAERIELMRLLQPYIEAGRKTTRAVSPAVRDQAPRR